jgi:hypothetical protein
MGRIINNKEENVITVRFGLADLLREPDHIAAALTGGAFQQFLASVAWSILDRHGMKPFEELGDGEFLVGEVSDTGEVFVQFKAKAVS